MSVVQFNVTSRNTFEFVNIEPNGLEKLKWALTNIGDKEECFPNLLLGTLITPSLERNLSKSEINVIELFWP